MNKILLNDEEKEALLNTGKYEFSKDGNYSLEFENFQKDIFLIVSKNTHVTLNLLGKNTDLSIHIHIKENAELTFHHLLIEGNFHLIVDLDGIGATFTFNYSVLSSQSSLHQIIVKHHMPKTYSYLKNHGFSRNHANVLLDISSYIEKNSDQCISKQDNQIIENDTSMSQIQPNLYIDNYDTEASHSAYLGEFKESDLFYLMSRGLSEEDSKFLLLKSFLIGHFELNDSNQERYYHEIIKYFNKEV